MLKFTALPGNPVLPHGMYHLSRLQKHFRRTGRRQEEWNRGKAENPKLSRTWALGIRFQVKRASGVYRCPSRLAHSPDWMKLAQ
jgi:hypothetical protein